MSGILGIVGNKLVVSDILKSLLLIQERGTESATIFVDNGRKHGETSVNGLVKDLSGKWEFSKKEDGTTGIAFVGNQIPTDGEEPHAQPMNVTLANGVSYSVCVSGIITNFSTLKVRLEAEGAIFKTNSYAELVAHLANRSQGDNLVRKTIEAAKCLEGSFSIIVMVYNHLIVIRDPPGNRTISFAKLPDGGYMFATETCAFKPTGAEFIREIEPGEAIIAGKEKITSEQYAPESTRKHCSLELINLSSAESIAYGKNVVAFRKELGRELGKQIGINADYIVPTPKAGQAFVIGLSEATGLPVVPAILSREHVLKHMFASPKSFLNARFGLLQDLLDRGSIVLADDLMQSTATAKFLIQLLRESGKIKGIELITSCPPVNKNLCQFRRSSRIIDKADYQRLKEKKITEYLGVESFSYLEVERIKKVFGENAEHFCFECLNSI